MSKHKAKRYAGEDESLVEADPMEMANKGTNLDTDTGPKAMPAVKPKAKVVTKEELAKSGLSLRDYMNKQQGLTRRSESGTPAASVQEKNKNYSDEGRGSTEKSSGYSNEGRGSKPKASTDYTLGKVPSREQAAANRAAVMDTVKSGLSGVGDYFRNLKTPAERRSEEAKNKTSVMKRGGIVKKMASGGSVSSRADGIAQRGKTRGKMC